MSSSIARKRRVNAQSTPSPAGFSSNSNNLPTGVSGEKNQMTLAQILSIFEKRLIAVENNNYRQVEETVVSSTPAVDESLKETLDEYESRFDMLAEQITYIKDTVIKLQTFTMEVNKTLFQIMREQTGTITLPGMEQVVGTGNAEDKVQIMREQTGTIKFSGMEQVVGTGNAEDREDDDDAD